MSRKKLRVSIEQVKELPRSKRERISEYDQLIEDIEGKDKGIYKIAVEGKKPKSIFGALSARLKTKKSTLKLHLIGNELFIEKLE